MIDSRRYDILSLREEGLLARLAAEEGRLHLLVRLADNSGERLSLEELVQLDADRLKGVDDVVDNSVSHLLLDGSGEELSGKLVEDANINKYILTSSE